MVGLSRTQRMRNRFLGISARSAGFDDIPRSRTEGLLFDVLSFLLGFGLFFPITDLLDIAAVPMLGLGPPKPLNTLDQGVIPGRMLPPRALGKTRHQLFLWD